ncbi:hypothetical protein RSAG8_04077, partial [Rhizoctonia solani AG-8 WAC10335]
MIKSEKACHASTGC